MGAYCNRKPHLRRLLSSHYAVVFQLAGHKGLGHYRVADGYPHAQNSLHTNRISDPTGQGKQCMCTAAATAFHYHCISWLRCPSDHISNSGNGKLLRDMGLSTSKRH